jgi:hypothetical protein
MPLDDIAVDMVVGQQGPLVEGREKGPRLMPVIINDTTLLVAPVNMTYW